jgi:hypothetical protein
MTRSAQTASTTATDLVKVSDFLAKVSGSKVCSSAMTLSWEHSSTLLRGHLLISAMIVYVGQCLWWGHGCTLMSRVEVEVEGVLMLVVLMLVVPMLVNVLLTMTACSSLLNLVLVFQLQYCYWRTSSLQ